MDKIIEACSKTYSEEDLALVQKALDFARDVHKKQKRESGEPYIVHPQEVAMLLYGMGMDRDSVIAGILHDVVEDCENVTIQQISAMFSKEIAELVDGVTKLTKSGMTSIIPKEEQQAENLRKMFLAMAKDIRVIIIKLADRLHNMRTLEYCGQEKRTRKAKETMEVYAPLAHRFGMGQMKAELEDLSFEHMLPEEYKNLGELIEPQQRERMELLKDVVETIKTQLKAAGIEAQVGGRPKHLYSIYKKLVKQNTTINEIYDLIALRVIVNTVNDCYAALGIIHSLWKPVPGRFKDYIAMPKTNMYRSLHTTLFSESGIYFEVQIRTHEMHRAAEYGIAAHWMYKEGRAQQDDLDNKLSWIRQMLEYEDDAASTKEFVDNIRKDFFSDYVYVLTPRGEIIDLPAGATPIDFAYKIHTNVGNHTQHAKVNGSMVKLDYKLKTHDVVEIVTAQNAAPSRDWLKIVKTQQAKNRIRHWFKKANREENIQRGKEMLQESVRRQGYQLTDLLKPEYYTPMLKRFNMSDMDDIYAAIGYGGMTTGQASHKLLEQLRREQKEKETALKLEQKEHSAVRTGTHGIIVEGEPDMAVRFSKCCSPLPGDEIIGYITRGRGVSIHRKDCPNMKDLSSEIERFVPVEWAADEKSSYSATIFMVGAERANFLLDISQTLINLNVGLTAINAKTDKNSSVSVQLSFDVRDAAQLENVIKNLHKITGVKEVHRINV